MMVRYLHIYYICFVLSLSALEHTRMMMMIMMMIFIIIIIHKHLPFGGWLQMTPPRLP